MAQVDDIEITFVYEVQNEGFFAVEGQDFEQEYDRHRVQVQTDSESHKLAKKALR